VLHLTLKINDEVKSILLELISPVNKVGQRFIDQHLFFSQPLRQAPCYMHGWRFKIWLRKSD
jgi:hypothetical protein